MHRRRARADRRRTPVSAQRGRDPRVVRDVWCVCGVALVALERPDGLLVERLLDAGLRVLPMHPNQVAAARARFRRRGRQDPTGSTHSCCASWRAPTAIASGCSSPTRDQTKALRALTRTREDLVHARVALDRSAACRARAILAGSDRPVHQTRQPDLARVPGALPKPGRRAWPGRAAPCRRSWRASTTREVRSQLQLLAKLKRAPEGRVGEAELAARRAARARPGHGDQAAGRADQAAHRARSPPHCASTRTVRSSCRCSATRDSVVTAADAARRDRRLPRRATPLATRSPPTPAKPPSRSSPASARHASFRWACNKRLRGAFCTLADSTRHWHPWAQDRYAAARARGARAPHARYAPSAAPGAGSSGAAGKTTPPTTRPATRALQQHFTVTVPTSSGALPDLAATQRRPGAAVTAGCPQGRARSA